MHTDDRYIRAADRLRAAAATRQPCPPIRDIVPADDLVGAYTVQRANTELGLAAGRRPAGRKIGLTSEPVQRMLGVDQPDCGMLFDDMVFRSDELLPFTRLLQPKAEAEIAVVLDRDLAGLDVTPEQARAAIRGVVPAIEVADSRIAGWDITFVDTVADNASAGLAVVGTEVPLHSDLDLASLEMSLFRNDVLESTGTGAASLGDPLNALAWLARTASESDDSLRSGEIILTGALGPVVDVFPGDVVDVEISALGTVRAKFDVGLPVPAPTG